MATTDKNTIKNWFKTGLKPTQLQFWNWMDSFWHKNESIPQSSVSNLTNVLNAKAEASQLASHFNDEDAHGLTAKLMLKSNVGHRHEIVEVNGLNEELQTIITDIQGLKTLVSSDDLNLDTVQEIVDAIKQVETSLETILVNDLITGGVTKALTAEQGKNLQENKADKGSYVGTLQDLKTEIIAITNALYQSIQNLEAENDYFQLINNQIYVSTSGPVLDSWHGKLVTFTANVTITVPATGLRTGFNFEGIVDPSVTVNTAMTAPKTWQGGYTGAPILENSIFTFIQRSNDSNKISIFGL